MADAVQASIVASVDAVKGGNPRVLAARRLCVAGFAALILGVHVTGLGGALDICGWGRRRSLPDGQTRT